MADDPAQAPSYCQRFVYTVLCMVRVDHTVLGRRARTCGEETLRDFLERMRVRLFVAVRISPSALSGFDRRLLESSAVALRWVPPENWHITLRFLGERQETEVPSLCSALRAALRPLAIAPFFVELVGLGSFPRPMRTRVLWAGVGSGREELRCLADRVRQTLAGPDEANGTWSAHLTLARVAGQGSLDLNAPIRRALQSSWGRQWVDHVELIQSERLVGGARYVTLASFGLRARWSAVYAGDEEGSRT